MSKTNTEGFPLIGWLVTWSTRNFSIERQELVKALEQAGIDASIAREVLPKNAAIRAIRKVAKGGGKFHRKVADLENRAAFVVASTDVNDNLDAEFSQDTKALFEKSSKNLVVKGRNKKEVEEAFEANKVTYAGDQFRAIVLRYVKRQCSAVTYLETGNVYLIPAAKEVEFNKIRDLFNILKDKGVSLNVKEEVSTKQSRGVFWDVTVGELSNEVRRMKEDLENLNSKDSVKQSTAIDRMGKYGKLRAKLELYEGALQQKALDLRSELQALEDAAKKLTVAS